jgi:hypothetical protein
MILVIPQAGVVGVNSTSTLFLFRAICCRFTTASCSSVMVGCSGSRIFRMRSVEVLSAFDED